MEQRREALSAQELELVGLVVAKKPVRDIASGMGLDFVALGELMRGIFTKRPGIDSGLLGLARLSAREWDVLLLAVDGEEVKHMQRLLGLSESAVKHYLEHAFGKAGDGSRAAATARYVEWRTLLAVAERS